MEALPRMPMLSFDLKHSPEYVEFAPTLKQYIQEHYGEDPAHYNKACTEIEQLRQSSVHVSRDFIGCTTLKKYYAQLQFLQGRFQLSEGGDTSMAFTWEDIQTGREHIIADIKFEQACILYNIGSLHSILGAIDNRNNAEGMKVSCTHFQCAAWAYEHLRDHFGCSAMSTDMAHEMLTFQINLMLAQAQECILEKSMLDNRKNTITAKVSAQVVEFYKLAIKNLDICNTEGLVNSRSYKDWKKRMELKVSFYQCITYYYTGKESEEKTKWGETLAYFTACNEKLTESIKAAKNEVPEIQDALKFSQDVVCGKYNSAKKDNDFVYHEKVPPLDTLPEVKGASLVKGIPFNPNDPEISGPDIFQKLVPMEAHEASSVYSEEKAKILRLVANDVEEKNSELDQFLSSLQLDVNKLTPVVDRLPEDLLEKCAALSVRTHAIQDLIDQMSAVSNVSTEVELNIKEILEILDAEIIKEEDFQKLFGNRCGNIILSEIRKETDSCNAKHKQGSLSNENLHTAMHTHIANLRLLAGQPEHLLTSLPSLKPNKTPEDDAVLEELRKLLNKVEEMRSQRAMLHDQLRDQIQSDDITNVLVTQDGATRETIFGEQLRKHDKLKTLLEQNMLAQNNILQALTDCNAKYATIRQTTTEATVQRESRVKELINSFNVYEDLMAKSQKGLDYYKKLEETVGRLLQRSRGVCKVQQEERDQINKRFAAKEPPPSRPSAPKPTAPCPSSPQPTLPSFDGPKLKDYLPFMKPATFGAKSKHGSASKSPNPNLDDVAQPFTDIQDPRSLLSGGYQPVPSGQYLPQNTGIPQPNPTLTHPEAEIPGPDVTLQGQKFPPDVAAQAYNQNTNPVYPGQNLPTNSSANMPISSARSQYQASMSRYPSVTLGYNPALSQSQIYRQDSTSTVSSVETPVISPTNESHHSLQQPINQQPLNADGMGQQSKSSSGLQAMPASQSMPGAGPQSLQNIRSQQFPSPGQQSIASAPALYTSMPDYAKSQIIHQPFNQVYTGPHDTQSPMYNQTPQFQNTGKSPQPFIHQRQTPSPARISNVQGYMPPASQQHNYQQQIQQQQMHYQQPGTQNASQVGTQCWQNASPSPSPNHIQGQNPQQFVNTPLTTTNQQNQISQAPVLQVYGQIPVPGSNQIIIPPSSQNQMMSGSGYPSANQKHISPMHQSIGYNSTEQRYTGQSNMTANQHAPANIDPHQQYSYQQTQPGVQTQHISPQHQIQNQHQAYPQPAMNSQLTTQQTAPLKQFVQGQHGMQSHVANIQSQSGQIQDQHVYLGQQSQQQQLPGQVPNQLPQINPGSRTGQPPQIYRSDRIQQIGQAPSSVPSSQIYYQQPNQYPQNISVSHSTASSQALSVSSAAQFSQSGLVPQVTGAAQFSSQSGSHPGQMGQPPMAVGSQVPGQYSSQHIPQTYPQTSQYQNQFCQRQVTPISQQPVTGQTGYQQSYQLPASQQQYQAPAASNIQYRYPGGIQPAGATSSLSGGVPVHQQGSQQYGGIQPQQHIPAQPGTAVNPGVTTISGTKLPVNMQQPLSPAPSATGIPRLSSPMPPEVRHPEQPKIPNLQQDLQASHSVSQINIPPVGNAQNLARQSSSLDEILSSSPDSVKQAAIPDPVIAPKVLTAQEKQQQKEEAMKNRGIPESKDPYCTSASLNKLVMDVERFGKRVDELSASEASAHSHVDIIWRELLEYQEQEGKKNSIAIARCYPMKNRDQDIMPYDATRVMMSTLKDDYINASWINDLAPSCPKFITTQTPLPVTTTDFWVMVYEHGTEVIVMITSEYETGKKYPIYWPTEKGKPMEHGQVILNLQSVKYKGLWTERIIYMLHTETKQGRTIVHLLYKNWPVSGFPDDVCHIVKFINETHTFYKQQRSLMKPIIVHCGNGIGRSGTFILIYTGMQEIVHGNGMIDIPLLTKRMLSKRKNCIQNSEQLRFAYEALLYFAEDFLKRRNILVQNPHYSKQKPKPPTAHSSADDIVLGSVNLQTIQQNVGRLGEKHETVVQGQTTITDSSSKGDNLSSLPDLIQQQSRTDNVNGGNSSSVTNMENIIQDGGSYSPQNRSRSGSNSSILSSGSLSSAASKSSPQHSCKSDIKSSPLADLQNPNTFTLDTIDKAKKRITKASFTASKKTSMKDNLDVSDPLSNLDPLWSIEKDKK